MHAPSGRKDAYTNMSVEMLGKLLDDEAIGQVLRQFPAGKHAYVLARIWGTRGWEKRDAPARLHVERVPRVERGVEHV